MSPEPKLPSVKSFPKSTETKWARMGLWLLALLTLNFALLISACGLDIEDPTPPSPPVWVQKSLPEEWPERGIDAHESGGIYLEWYSQPEIEIMAYHVFRATWYETLDSLGDYELLASLERGSIGSTEFVDEEISILVRYFYKLKAENDSGILSEYSDSLNYMLMPAVRIFQMSPNGQSIELGSERRLSWTYYYSVEMEDYCISILTQNNQILYRDNFQPTNYEGHTEVWIIPDEVDLISGQVYRWRVDTGSSYIDRTELTGSESPWATFLFIGD